MNDPPTRIILHPDDEHDRKLLANVHPADWRNPVATGRYHLVVIGGGTAGLVTAAIGAALGARVALVERGMMGGDCLNFGCVPSKALIAAARGWRDAREGTARFGAPAVSGEGDFAAVMDRLRRIRAEISEHDSAARFRELGVDVFLGHATFTRPDEIAVDGQRLRFRRAVIAAGTRPTIPAIPGLAEARVLTNESVFALTALPARLVVIGGGPIGCELAQAFALLGSRVTLLEEEGRILSNDDPEAAKVVADRFKRDGIEVICGANVVEAAVGDASRAVTYEAGGQSHRITTDEILVAVGRTPRTDDLGLESAGIDFDTESGIKVDDRLRTTNPRVFAIGDIATPFRFTHVADAHARMVVRNALFFGRARASDFVIPWCTYTSPELAHVGLTPAEVGMRGVDVESITVTFENVDRARLEGDTDGFLRVHLRAGSDAILGATAVGTHAGEIIGQLAHAIAARVGLATLGETILPYPTRGEIVRKAADQWRRRKLTARAEKGLRVWFRMMG